MPDRLQYERARISQFYPVFDHFPLMIPVLDGSPDLVPEYQAQDDDAVKDLIDEAEDLQRMLQAEQPDPVPDSVTDSVGDAEADESVSTETDDSDGQSAVKAKPADDSDDATVLDEESADPEIKLDLARAYISMGDKEAARTILDEVIEHGSEEQQSEAKEMKQGL